MTTAATTAESESFTDSIEQAAERVGSIWPIHSFVTANPLAGFEDRPFHEAVAEANELFGGQGYPDPSVFRQAWEAGRIDPELLREELDAHGIDEEPETLLEGMADREDGRSARTDEATAEVDRLVTKWLSVFLDQGEATWSMPNREEGFYAAWRELAPYDDELPECTDPADLPATAQAAIETVAARYPEDRWDAICEHHFAALPGWTGFIKQRADDEHDPWQGANPITLEQYMAVRVTMADLLGVPIDPADREDHSGQVSDDRSADGGRPVAEQWLTAWERSYRNGLLTAVESSMEEAADDSTRPAAQLVFCIDTRSEIIRRHIESQGEYETHGYAGFFGIPMQHEGYDTEAASKACPPIVEPEHHIADRPVAADDEETHSFWTGAAEAVRHHFETLKTNTVAAFTFVEGAGSAYATGLAARTLFPSQVATIADAIDDRVPSPDDFCEADLSCDGDHTHEHSHGDLTEGMSHEQQVEYAATAFDLMGWTEFARLVVFTGHAAHTTNNPFDSSLDCGACAGSAGGPNARVLAQICNQDDVKDELRDRGFDVPDDTVFVAAEHNTTTDEITIFEGQVPESHVAELEALEADLQDAREAAAAERAATMPAADGDDAVTETKKRAFDWAETRPEWGLAGNAGFVIGPRELTDDADLEGRAFLHSYDWSTDPDGDALEAILAGPLVVTQWINNQYYFATVDNAVYGSGSKVTQNPLGNVGVVQGNGGDLMSGLPLQSLKATDDDPFHQPLRLSAVIHAPVDRVTEILADHDEVTGLLDNGWLSLTVIDPQQDNRTLHYDGELSWQGVSDDQQAERPAPVMEPIVADD